MNQQAPEKEEFIEIDFQRLFETLLKKAWVITIVSVLCAVLAFCYTFYFVTPAYQSSSMFYVNNSDISVGSASLSLSSSDITASRGLVDTYIVILNTRQTLDSVIEKARVDLTYSQVRNMITAEAIDETEVFQVTVTDTDPIRAERIANAIADILPKRIAGIVEGTSARVVETALVPTSPSSPSYSRNTVLGFVLGFALTVAFILIRQLMDNTVRSEADVKQVCELPILAAVPDMIVPEKGGYYGYGEDGQKKKKKVTSPEERPVIGSDISFAASEAYKLLRTMLEYSFADEKNCRIIGITSAMTGEGKSLTAVNLALNLAQMRNRVLLVDCDMRRPSVAAKLGMNKTPGLSGFLSGQKEMKSLIRQCGIKGNEKAFHVITSGTNPPNPMELLGSVRMEKMLDALRDLYDYIILDLPPVCEVSDALVVAKRTDGMLMVVRENYCSRSLLNEAVRKLEFVDARVLGISYNCTNKESGRYGKKYYKSYYKSYSRAGYQKDVSEGVPVDLPDVEV